MKENKLKKQPIKDRTYLTPEKFKKLKGTLESHQYVYNTEKKLYVKNIKRIQGVAAARRKAPTYILATDVGKIGEMYLMEDGKLTNDKKEAKKFYHGFDEPEIRKRFWKEQTKLSFHVCNF